MDTLRFEQRDVVDFESKHPEVFSEDAFKLESAKDQQGTTSAEDEIASSGHTFIKIGKFIPGEQILTELKIRDFELFYDYVKKELLQPFNELGQLKPPPDISFKLAQLKKYQTKLDNIKSRHRVFSMSVKEQESLMENLGKDPQKLLGALYVPPLTAGEYKTLQKEIKSLEEELSKIDDIYSWKNYDLPDSDTQAKKVLDELVNSLYLEEEVLKISPQIKGLPQVTEKQKMDQIKKDSTKSESLKAFTGLAEKASKEIGIIWNAMMKHLKSIKVEFDNSKPSELQQVSIDILNDPEYKFTWVKEKYLKDSNFFTEMRDSSQPKRYFREHILQQIIKENTHKKDITISEIRELLKKI